MLGEKKNAAGLSPWASQAGSTFWRENGLWAKVRARQRTRFSGSIYLSQGPYQRIHTHSTKNINNIYLLHRVEWSGVPRSMGTVVGEQAGLEESMKWYPPGRVKLTPTPATVHAACHRLLTTATPGRDRPSAADPGLELTLSEFLVLRQAPWDEGGVEGAGSRSEGLSAALLLNP